MPNWNKEIKLSDLFKRRQKAPKEASAAAATASESVAVPEPSAPKQSFLRKEISFSRRRKEKTPKEPRARKPSRAERRAAKKQDRAEAKAAKPTRAEGRAAKRAEREVAKAEKAARKSAPKEPRRSRRQAPPVPAVPIMRAFNLLPRDDARDGRGRRPSTAQLVLAVIALLAFAAVGAYFLMLNAQVADKRSEADSLRAAAAARPSPAPAPTLDDADTELQQEQQARTTALAGALGRRVAWDRLLRDFSLVMPDDVSLTKLTASGGGSAGAAAQTAAPGTPPPDNTFTIEGYTKSQEAVALVLARLSVLPELSAVDLQSSTAAQLGGESVFQFVITTTAKAGTGSTL